MKETGDTEINFETDYYTDNSTDYSSNDNSSAWTEKPYCVGYKIGSDYNGDGIANDRDYQDKTADDIDQIAKDMAEGKPV